MKNKLKYLLSCFCSLKYFPRYFMFNGKMLKYENSIFNLTWANERAIEIPIILSYWINFDYGKVLEIGNVLFNYNAPVGHKVIDRDELGTDLYTHKFTKKYDLIVSISTIEHMDDFEKALDIIKGLLNKGGKAIITLPVGYKEYSIGRGLFSEKYFMIRKSWSNKWEQKHYVPDIRYGEKYPAANAIMIGIING